MPNPINQGWIVAFSLFAGLLSLTAAAQVQFVETVVDGNAPPPAVAAFDVNSGGPVTVTVTDFGVAGTPVAPAANIYLLVYNTDARSSALVATDAGVESAELNSGNHQVTLIAVPDSATPRASIGVSIVRNSDSAILFETVEVFDATPGITNPAAVEFEFTAPAAGDFEFTLADQGFPVSLTGATAIFIRAADGVPLGTLPGSGQLTLTLAAGDVIRATIVATRAEVDDRSRLSLTVDDGTSVVDRFVAEIGDWSAVLRIPVDLDSSGDWTLQVTDFAQPSTVAGLTAAVLQNEVLIGPAVVSGGSAGLIGVTGPAMLFVASDDDALGTAGIQITSASGAIAYADVLPFEAADGPDDNSAVIESRFSLATAQTVSLVVTDFQFPAAFIDITAAIVSEGSIVATLNSAGTLPVDLPAGEYAVTVIGRLPVGASGLLGMNVLDSSGVGVAEGVAAGGSAIRSINVSVTSSDLLRLSLVDLGFPESFQTLSVALTQGASLQGSAFGGGDFAFDAAPGDYQLNVVTVPGSSTGYSTYSAVVEQQARAPQLDFTASGASVATGGSVTLSWSSEFADNCTASGGWSGSRAVTGTETIANVTAAASYTLTCAGPGGSVDSTLSVSVTSAEQAGGGGGGAASWIWLLALLAAVKRSVVSMRAGKEE